MNPNRSSFPASVASIKFRRTRCAALALAAVSLFGQSAQAATQTWNGSNVNWQTTTSWTAAGMPTSTSLNEFNSNFGSDEPTTGTTAAVSGAVWVTTGVTSSVTISGTGTLTISGALSTGGPAGLVDVSILLDDTANNSLTINAPLAVSGTSSFLVNNAGTLTVAGGLTIANTKILTLGSTTSSGTGSIAISSNIAATSGSIVVNDTAGSATVVLSGVNAYTGTTTVTAGTLQLSGSGTLGATSATLIVNGGVLDLNGTSQTVGNFSSTATAGTILNNGTGTSTLTFGTATNESYTGVIADNNNSGTGIVALTKTGTGTQTFSGNNTFSGGVNLSAGTLVLNSATAIGTGTLTIAAGTTLNTTVTGGITLANNNAQTWNGSFTSTFTAAEPLNLGTGNVTMSGPLTVTVTTSGSTLTVGGNITDPTNGANAWLDITKAGAGTLALGENVTLATTVDDANISAGTLALAGAITLSGNTTITTPTGGALSLTGVIDGGGSSNSITKDGAGTLIITGNNNFYGGGTILDAGVLELGSNHALADNILTMNGGELSSVGSTALTLADVFVSTSATVTFGDAVNTGAITLTAPTFGDGSTSTFAAATTLSAAVLATGSDNVTFIPLSGKTLTLDGASGNNGLILGSATPAATPTTVVGTVVTGGTFTETGNTTLQGGVLLSIIPASQLSGTITISSSATTSPNAGGASVIVANNFIVDANSQWNVENGGTGGDKYTGTLSLGAGSTLNLAAPSTRGQTFTGPVTLLGNTTFEASSTTTSPGVVTMALQGNIGDGGDDFGITIEGSGVSIIQFSGANTFTGGVTIDSGILQLASAGALNSANPNTVSFGAGSTGILELNGQQTTVAGLSTDPTTVGTPIVENDSATVASTLTVSNSVDSTYGGVIQNGAAAALALAKSGTGAFTVTGNNTYSGGTAISNGTFYANSSNSTGTGAVAVNSGGTLGGTGTIDPTTTTGVNAVSVATGGLIAPGGIQPLASPTAVANGNLTLDPTNVTVGSSNLLNVAASTNASTASLTFALGAGNAASGSKIMVGGSAINVINFNAGGGSGTVVSINDLVAGGLTLNQNYVLIQGNGSTTFEDNGVELSVGAGTLTASGMIIGGLELLAPNTAGNFFSQWYNSSELFFDSATDSIDVEVIPEPGTWALMLGGFCLLVVYQRRRRDS